LFYLRGQIERELFGGFPMELLVGRMDRRLFGLMEVKHGIRTEKSIGKMVLLMFTLRTFKKMNGIIMEFFTGKRDPRLSGLMEMKSGLKTVIFTGKMDQHILFTEMEKNLLKMKTTILMENTYQD